MRSKGGYLRNMNSITVEGSLKMVISPMEHTHTEESTVYISSHIAAESTKIPQVINGTVIESHVEDGDYGLLVRQPVLWYGGIRPCRIRVVSPKLDKGLEWDVNSSIGVPISMYATFSADFDGDEMSLFPVKSTAAVNECRSAFWDNLSDSPYSEEGYNSLVGGLLAKITKAYVCTQLLFTLHPDMNHDISKAGGRDLERSMC